MATDVASPLSELEWKCNMAFPELGDYPCEISIELVADFVQIREWEYGDDPVKVPTIIQVPYGARHALAALALDEQPFGFTREDVEILRACMVGFDGSYPWDADMIDRFRSLADRIAALLPPEEESR